MDILRDITSILKKYKDDSHFLEIKIAWDGIIIYLDDDPEKNFEQNYVIPICYDSIDNVIYISDSEYKKNFKDTDFGITYSEIILIKDIMDYLNLHKEELSDICKLYDFEERLKEPEDEYDFEYDETAQYNRHDKEE